MASFLYDIIILPLVYLIEFVFSLFWHVTGSPGIAIIGVSIAVNVLCLPLYRMADEAQDRERAKQQSMKHWVDHINKTFKGDERYMMLSTYYLEQGYRPVQALVGSLSLLLQIPFFMAAYAYLSNLDVLQGQSFLFLQNLGAPDALLQIGGLTINVLPIVMTLLNCISTIVYTKGLPLRDKAQAYLLAAVFLVLLYDSPSGLVFYWTCNQLFSLFKNIFMKVLPNPRTWALALIEICVVGGSAWLIMSGKINTPKRALFLLAIFGISELVLLWYARHPSPSDVSEAASPVPFMEKRTVITQFLLAGVFLTCLLGLLIPSAVVADSPFEFISIIEKVNPLESIAQATLVWFGALVLWVGIYFALSDERIRVWYALAGWAACGICVLDYFFFGRDLGTISSSLVFDVLPSYSAFTQIINLMLLAAIVVGLAFVYKKANRVVIPALSIITAATLVLAVPNFMTIGNALQKAQTDAKQASQDNALVSPSGEVRPLLHLSKTKKNVIILFLDRGISGYLPYIMQERPELREQFDGFVYYPNTLSFGMFTCFGTPPLYGGYEYTTQAMNARTDKTIPEKQNEALLVLPTLFSKAGYQTTVIDPPYANYQWVPDVSIYNGLKNTEAVAVRGAYTPLLRQRYGIASPKANGRSFFCYSLFKTLPVFAQGVFYSGGSYLSTSVNTAPKPSLLDEYAVLDSLIDMTDVTSDRGGFLQICNNTTHEEDYLQLPNYEPAQKVNNDGLEDMSRFVLNGRKILMEDDKQLMHYHVNAAALINVGEWFDWMRKQGVYDNTRIIIISDHGRPLDQFEGWRIDEDLDVEMVNPLFMVKDYNSHGFTTSNEFMTQADVPTLATEGLIKDPTNPFTGVPLTMDEKTAHPQLTNPSYNWEIQKHQNRNTFDMSDKPWYSVHDNIFDMNNWERLDKAPGEKTP